MLEITNHGRVREIRLNRPPVNAMDPALIAALAQSLDRAGQEADAVVVSGSPGMFSAGLDIPVLLQLDREGIARFWRAFLHALHAVAHMPVPTAFALTGHAPAGGIVMSLFSDYRIMSAGKYKTGLNEVQVGLVVAPVIKSALVRLLGPHPAEKILVPGTLLAPEQALAIGLVDELAETPDTAVARAIAWCDHLLGLPRNAMSMTRRMSREDLCRFFEEEDQYRVEVFVDLWFSEMTQSILRNMVERLKKK
jgi:enoyl-CoA hydratase/carnithine racemase